MSDFKRCFIEAQRFVLLALVVIVVNGCATVELNKNIRTLSEQNLVDIIVGSCIQSTRNCDPSLSIEKIKQVLSDGKVFTLISPEDIALDGMVVAVQGIGGGGAWEHVIERTKEQKLPIIEDQSRQVVELLSEYMGKDFSALVRSEAAGATSAALLLSADLGIPTLDAGITGRAVPEVQQ